MVFHPVFFFAFHLLVLPPVPFLSLLVVTSLSHPTNPCRRSGGGVQRLSDCHWPRGGPDLHCLGTGRLQQVHQELHRYAGRPSNGWHRGLVEA